MAPTDGKNWIGGKCSLSSAHLLFDWMTAISLHVSSHEHCSSARADGKQGGEECVCNDRQRQTGKGKALNQVLSTVRWRERNSKTHKNGQMKSYHSETDGESHRGRRNGGDQTICLIEKQENTET